MYRYRYFHARNYNIIKHSIFINKIGIDTTVKYFTTERNNCKGLMPGKGVAFPADSNVTVSMLQ